MPPVNKAKCIWSIAIGSRVNKAPLNYFYPFQNTVSLFLKKKDYTWKAEFVNITSIYYNNNNSNKLCSIDEEHSTKQNVEEKKKEIKIIIHTLYYNSCEDEIFKAKSIIAKQFLKFSVLKTTGN